MTVKSLISWITLVWSSCLARYAGFARLAGVFRFYRRARIAHRVSVRSLQSPDAKATVREALLQMGAIFNYDFGDLNAFVVSLPEGALEKVARHPDVADHWLAQASAKNHS